MFRIRDEENIKANSDYFTETNLKAMTIGLIFAATEGNTVALYNLFALMVTDQDLTKRVQEEIDSVVGRGRLPKLSDRANMPFTVATTFEALRYTAALGPVAAQHRFVTLCFFFGCNHGARRALSGHLLIRKTHVLEFVLFCIVSTEL